MRPVRHCRGPGSSDSADSGGPMEEDASPSTHASPSNGHHERPLKTHLHTPEDPVRALAPGPGRSYTDRGGMSGARALGGRHGTLR